MDDQSRIALVRVGSRHPDDQGEQVQYHLGDHLGSSHVVVGGDSNTSNAFINREEYFPYGETSFGSFGRKRYRYSGKERDEESSLYYYGARYLAPWLARWVSCDPAGPIDAPNLYGFTLSSPLNFVDRTGLNAMPENSDVADNLNLQEMERRLTPEQRIQLNRMQDPPSVIGPPGSNPGDDYPTYQKWYIEQRYQAEMQNELIRQMIALNHSAPGFGLGAGLSALLGADLKTQMAVGGVLSAGLGFGWAAVGRDAGSNRAQSAMIQNKMDIWPESTTVNVPRSRAADNASRGAPEPERQLTDGVASLRIPRAGGADVSIIRVRHFTRKSSLRQIEESGIIRAGDQNSVFTVRARGRPGSPRDVEKRLGIKLGKGNAYIEFDAIESEFEITKNPLTGATEYIFKGNIMLEGRNAVFQVNR
jgi:RHS repeat-associated protein